MKHVMVLAFFGFSGLSSTAQPTSILWGAPADCGAPGQGALRPRIAVNADGNPVVLWGDSGPDRNYVAVGNGAGFSAPTEVSTAGCVPAVADWMGSSIAAVGNTVWVVMKATPEESEPIYVRRSNDGGLSWGDTLRVDPFDGLVSRFPSIDLIDPDTPVVQYMQFDNGWNGARQVVSHMMGGSFMPPVQVSSPFAPGDVCDCCPNQIVMDNDHAVALYRNAGTNLRVMWGAVSTDGGASFPVGGLVDTTDWVLNACPSSGPDGYLDDDSIHYVWMSGATNGAKVYLGSALASDLSLGGQRNAHPGQAQNLQQNFPRIAGSGDTLGVVWQQALGTQVEILFSWSVSGPAGLSAPDTVNIDLTGAQRTPDIAFANGAFHIVWGEQGSGHVRYRKATLVNAQHVDMYPALEDEYVVWPNPVGDVLHFNTTGPVPCEILDTEGRIVLGSHALIGGIDVHDLAPGRYVCRVGWKGKVRSIPFQKD
ncbi:MAG: T9SS type A sorting domain-containing protein [Flavobacteriales bacterium]|nr:T9SS type A sorting domain-containing protein [Flavobacteriales bacterium]